VRRLAGESREARLITVGTLLAIVVAVVAFLALEEDADDESVPTGYVAEADRICVQGKERVALLGQQSFSPESNDPNPLDDYVVASIRITREVRVDLGELEPPADLREEAEALDAALGEVIAALTQLGRAASTGEDLLPAVTRVEAAQDTSEQAVEGLGLRACSRLEVGLEDLRSG
jgi:hypothetical protein